MHVKEQQAEFGIKIREEQPTITKKCEDNNYEYKTIQKIEPQQSKYDALINLENYVLFKKAKFLPLSKYYKIKDKTTGDIFLAQMTKPLKNENYSQIISDISLLINTLSKLNHPCLIKYIGYSPFNFKYKLNPIIITEHAKNFNLIDFLKNEHIILEHKLIIIYGIASGMSYLHLHNIIHPDLKPSNILIDSFLLPKIVNYSNSILLSKITNKKKHRKIKIESKEGKSLEKSIERTNESETIDESRYLAPETLEKSEITESSNVYSFGCIAYDIIDDVYKFSSNKMKVYNFNSFSRECKEIIEKSMSKCPQDRPTFDEIISKLKDYEEYSFFDDNLYDFHGYIKYIDESKNNNNKSIGNFESGTYIYKKKNRKTNQIKTNEMNEINKNETDLNNKIININRFYKMKFIGSGSFGKVFKVKEISTGKIFAAKIIKSNISSDYKLDNNSLDFFREIKIMSALNHPSIIKFIGYSSVDFQGSPYPTTIIEFASNGTLQDIINLEKSGRSPDGWDETQKLITIYGIASGMQYLHSNNLIHRDLKPGNILMDDNLFPKIADFGYAKVENPNNVASRSLQQQSKFIGIYKGSPLYMSPETLRDCVYTKECDVFAFGILVYEILTLRQPYSFSNYYELLKKVGIEGVRPKMTSDIPKQFHYLINACLNMEPKKRPLFDEIVKKLKYNKHYMTELINENEYYDYIKYIENQKKSFDLDQSIRFKELADEIEKAKMFQKVRFNENSESEEDKSENTDVSENENSESEKDQSENTNESDEDFLYGKKLLNQKKFKEAKKIMQKSAKKGNLEAIYEYGKIIFCGRGCEKNEEKSMMYFNMSCQKGFEKSKQFLMIYQNIVDEKHFNEFNNEIKLFLINQIMKNDFTYDYFISNEDGNKLNKWKRVNIKLNKTIEFYNYKLFESSNFLNFLECFQEVFIQANYPSEILDSLRSAIEFSENKTSKIIVNVTLLNSIDKIKDKAFKKMNVSIENEMPQSLIEIGNYAFYGNSTLTQITIPTSVTTIGKSAFKKCTSLTHLSIPSSVTIIGEEAFSECTLLKSIIISTKITFIKDYTFNYCSSLTEIQIPFSVTIIGDFAFQGCSSLKEIIIPSSVTSIGKGSFRKCSSLTQLEISNSITTICDYTFSECLSLAHLSIPSSVTSIGDYAFNECSLLSQILLPSSLKSINNYTFNRCSSLVQIEIPSSVTSINHNAFGHCSSLTQIIIPISVTSIGQFAFCGCSSLKRISIPSSVISIGKFAFIGCSSLEKILINNTSIKSIEDGVFESCSSLKEMIIPSSVISIGNNSFKGCSLLSEIIIPSSVISIKGYAFQNCYSLEKVTLSSSMTSIEENLFQNCKKLVQIIIPSSITSIKSNAFDGCSSLNQISIPKSVVSFGSNVFQGIQSLDIKGDIECFSNRLFENCSSLQEIKIPPTVKSLKSYVFKGCKSLSQLVIPPSVTCIGYHAFKGCNSLKQISLPSSLNIHKDMIPSGANIIKF